MVIRHRVGAYLTLYRNPVKRLLLSGVIERAVAELLLRSWSCMAVEEYNGSSLVQLFVGAVVEQ